MAEGPKFIPLTELSSSVIRVSDNLPSYVNRSLIGVNINGVKRLCTISGIEHVRLTGRNDEETSSFTPNIVGINESGEGVSAKSGTAKQVPIYSSDSQLSNRSVRKTHPNTWITTDITVNLAEVGDRIQERVRVKNDLAEGVRTPSAWAHYFDEALRNGIQKEGNDFLLAKKQSCLVLECYIQLQLGEQFNKL